MADTNLCCCFVRSRSLLYDSIVSLWSEYWRTANQLALGKFRRDTAAMTRKEVATR